MTPAWADYFSLAKCFCPFMGKRPWLFVPKEIDVVVLELDCAHSVDFLNLITKVVQPQLISLGLNAVPLHPEHPFQIRGQYVRRTPSPALNIIRADVAAETSEHLRQRGYYDRDPWRNPEDWQPHFPGLEES